MEASFEVPTFTVSGRTFAPTKDTTFEQDLFIMDIVTEAGLSEDKFELDSTGKHLSNDAANLVLKAYRSGRLFLLLAGILEEQDKPWTVDAAYDNANFFSKLSSKEDKKAIQAAVVGTVLSFFMAGDGSLRIFPKSLPRPVESGPSPEEESPEVQEAQKTSVSGTKLLEQ